MRNRVIIQILNHTWGIVMTLIGYTVRLVLWIAGIKGTKVEFTRVYKVGKGWGGLNLGTTILVASDCNMRHTVPHELGHSIQNAMFGVLSPFLVTIPSAIRYHYRRYLLKKGIEPKTDYDAIWFEGQATKLGTEYLK